MAGLLLVSHKNSGGCRNQRLRFWAVTTRDSHPVISKAFDVVDAGKEQH